MIVRKSESLIVPIEAGEPIHREPVEGRGGHVSELFHGKTVGILSPVAVSPKLDQIANLATTAFAGCFNRLISFGGGLTIWISSASLLCSILNPSGVFWTSGYEFEL